MKNTKSSAGYRKWMDEERILRGIGKFYKAPINQSSSIWSNYAFTTTFLLIKAMKQLKWLLRTYTNIHTEKKRQDILQCQWRRWRVDLFPCGTDTDEAPLLCSSYSSGGYSIQQSDPSPRYQETAWRCKRISRAWTRE